MMLRSGLFDFMMLRNFKRFFYTAARPLLCIEKQLTGFSVREHKKGTSFWFLCCLTWTYSARKPIEDARKPIEDDT